MKILSIETSCDETAIAILQDRAGKKYPNPIILSNVINSQVELHQEYGGVYPSLARREHQRNLVPVLIQAMKQAKMLDKIRAKNIRKKDKKEQAKVKQTRKILEREKDLLKITEEFLTRYKKPRIDFLAVTIGPGLEPCLWTGVNFAKALSFYWNIPIIPINHIEAHIYASFLSARIYTPKIFPAICLIVSGGHTQLILMKGFNDYNIIGETRDDASGECFDKTARILGLSYPGGPSIAHQAKKNKILKPIYNINLPRPMMCSKNYDFSFSGLKTAVLYDFKKRSLKMRKDPRYIEKMAFEIQQAIIDVLIKKTIKSAKDYKAKTIILGGGVSANKELRKQFKKIIERQTNNITFLIPKIEFATDNGVMIGLTAFYHTKDKKNWKKIRADANLRLN